MRGGALKESALIQRKVRMGTTDIGEPQFVYQTVVDALCEVESRRGREHFDPGTKQRFAQVVFHFRFRWIEVEGVDETMQIVFNGQEFDIQSILPYMMDRRDVVIEGVLRDGHMPYAPMIMAFLNDNVPVGQVGVVYPGFVVQASDGTAPYSFSVQAGPQLPSGLTLSSSTGAVTGTPTVIGTRSGVVIKVTDAGGKEALLPPIDLVITA